MQSIAAELEAYIEQYIGPLHAVPEEELNFKPSPVKWSKKEILGHLVDSAQNNIRRFIVGQYETEPQIVYNQDKWVALTNYQQYASKDLADLWYLINKHIVQVLKHTSPEMAQRKCRTENLNPIEWLAQDYIKHMRHHVHQVLSLEEVTYP